MHGMHEHARLVPCCDEPCIVLLCKWFSETLRSTHIITMQPGTTIGLRACGLRLASVGNLGLQIWPASMHAGSLHRLQQDSKAWSVP